MTPTPLKLKRRRKATLPSSRIFKKRTRSQEAVSSSRKKRKSSSKPAFSMSPSSPDTSKFGRGVGAVTSRAYYFRSQGRFFRNSSRSFDVFFFDAEDGDTGQIIVPSKTKQLPQYPDLNFMEQYEFEQSVNDSSFV